MQLVTGTLLSFVFKIIIEWPLLDACVFKKLHPSILISVFELSAQVI